MRRYERCSRATGLVGLALVNKRHLCAASKNNKVCFDQSFFRFFALLLLAFRKDRFLTTQSRKIRDEATRGHEAANIHIDWVADRRVRVANHHLSSKNENRITRMSSAIQ